MTFIGDLNKLTRKELIEDVYSKLRTLRLEIENSKKKNIMMKHEIQDLENKYNIFLEELPNIKKRGYQNRKSEDKEIWNLRNSGVSFLEISKKKNLTNNDCRKAYNRVNSQKIRYKKLKNPIKKTLI